MPKLTPDDLKIIRENTRKSISLREDTNRAKITVHMGTCGIASGAREILAAVENEIKTRDIKDVIVSTSGCAGLCSKEPMATVELINKPPVKYVELTADKIKKIFEDHILSGNVVYDYALAIGNERAF